jgi:hypothetical protein
LRELETRSFTLASKEVGQKRKRVPEAARAPPSESNNLGEPYQFGRAAGGCLNVKDKVCRDGEGAVPVENIAVTVTVIDRAGSLRRHDSRLSRDHLAQREDV